MDCTLVTREDLTPYLNEFEAAQFRPLAQHSAAWQRLSESRYTWYAMAAFHANRLLGFLPFCEIKHDIGSVWMSGPLAAGYGGILRRNDVPSNNLYPQLLSAWLSAAREAKIDVLSLFNAPFFDDRELYREALDPDFIFDKFYQYLPDDFDPDNAPNWKIRGFIKRQRKRASDAGLSVAFSGVEGRPYLPEWYSHILCPRFSDFGATPAPLSFFADLFDALAPAGLCRFGAVRQDDKMVAGGLFLTGWSLDIYLRAATTEFMRQGAGFLLDDAAIQLGRNLGCGAINFQSSPSKESPSYTYKRNWGCAEAETSVFTKILTDVAPFIRAGKDAVSQAFPGFFVLPYNVYEESS